VLSGPCVAGILLCWPGLLLGSPHPRSPGVCAACGGLGPSPACWTYQPGPFVGLAAGPAPPYITSDGRSGRGIGDFMSPFISYNRGRIPPPEQTALDSVCQHTLRVVSRSDTSLPSSSGAATGRSRLAFGNGAEKVKADPLARAGNFAGAFGGGFCVFGGFLPGVPQNHRMFGVGRALCGSPSTTPCPSRVTQSRGHSTASRGVGISPEREAPSFGGKAVAGSGELCRPRAAALLGGSLRPSGGFSMSPMSVCSRAREEEVHGGKRASGCRPLRFPKGKRCDRAEGSGPIQRWVRGGLCSGWARAPRDHSKQRRTPCSFWGACAVSHGEGSGLSLGTGLCGRPGSAGEGRCLGDHVSGCLRQIRSSDKERLSPVRKQDSPCCLSLQWGASFALLPLPYRIFFGLKKLFPTGFPGRTVPKRRCGKRLAR